MRITAAWLYLQAVIYIRPDMDRHASQLQQLTLLLRPGTSAGGHIIKFTDVCACSLVVGGPVGFAGMGAGELDGEVYEGQQQQHGPSEQHNKLW
jgi:hypothetical protein